MHPIISTCISFNLYIDKHELSFKQLLIHVYVNVNLNLKAEKEELESHLISTNFAIITHQQPFLSLFTKDFW